MPKLRFDFSMCVSLEMMLVFMIVLCTIVQVSSLISLCFALSFVLMLFYLFVRMQSKQMDLTTLMTALFTLICVIVNYATSTEARGGFNYFKKMIMFIAFCLSLYMYSEDTVSERCMVIVRRIPVLAALILALSYYSGFNTITYAHGLTLGFTNPNFTGLWLFHLLVFCTLTVVEKKSKKIVKLIALALVPALIQLILLTGARSCLIGLIAFAGLWFLFQISNVRFKKFVAIGAILFPLLFALVYEPLLENDMFRELFSSMESEGKTLTSRKIIWSIAFDAIEKSPLWGDYSGISHGTGASQLHNTHLDVLASYGIVTLALFIVMLLQRGNKVIESNKTLYQNCAVSGFLAIIIAGTFEAAVVSGAMGLNLLTVALLLLANQSQPNIT